MVYIIGQKEQNLVKYKVGMYGGSFNPLHIEHIRCIITAANQCEQLILALSVGKNREDEICEKQRRAWLYHATSHLEHVKIVVICDEAKTKEDYTEKMWLEGFKKIKESSSTGNIDVVFLGDDYGDDMQKLYRNSKLVFLSRNEISSTAIRQNVYQKWDWMPSYVREYFVMKILVVGSESTGKSTLVQNLANYYNTNFVSEVGREISGRNGGTEYMLLDDFRDILLQHANETIKQLKNANKVIFIDTDALTTLYYLYLCNQGSNDTYFSKLEALAETIYSVMECDYHRVLFLEPEGVNFIQDGTRTESIKTDRKAESEALKMHYISRKSLAFGAKLKMISGGYDDRFDQAVTVIDDLIADFEWHNFKNSAIIN